MATSKVRSKSVLITVTEEEFNMFKRLGKLEERSVNDAVRRLVRNEVQKRDQHIKEEVSK